MLILTAMELEGRAVAGALGLTVAGAGIWRGDQMELRTVGIRACRLEGAWIEGAKVVIMAGVAGGLDPSLRIGDVVVDGELEFTPPEGMRRGSIHTVEGVVCAKELKRELWETTGALAVDMENAIVKLMAAKAGVRFIGVRAILDTAERALPQYLGDITDDLGRPLGLKLVGRMLRRPVMLGELMRLRKESVAAMEAVGKAVEKVVEAIRSSGG